MSFREKGQFNHMEKHRFSFTKITPPEGTVSSLTGDSQPESTRQSIHNCVWISTVQRENCQVIPLPSLRLL